jgi:hypothetical protein
MRTTEKIAILIGLIMISGIIVYPPCVVTSRSVHVYRHEWLMSLPDHGVGWSSQIDLSRLLLQVLLVCVAIGATILALRTVQTISTLRGFVNSILSNRRGLNRLFILSWMFWLGYWVLYVNWRWANTPGATFGALAQLSSDPLDAFLNTIPSVWFSMRFKQALMASMYKSSPPGVEYIAGLTSPAWTYFGGMRILRWLGAGWDEADAR